MKQPHTEDAVSHTDDQQNTGNHVAPGQAKHIPGGTRQGAENVGEPVTNIEKGTDVDKVAGLEENLDDSLSVNGPTERVAERDEHGRM